MGRVRFVLHLPVSAKYLMQYLARRYKLPVSESNEMIGEVIKVGIAALICFKEIRQVGHSVCVVSKEGRILGPLIFDLRRLALEKKNEFFAVSFESSAETAAIIYEIAEMFKLVNPAGADNKDMAIALSLQILEKWDEALRRGNRICVADEKNNVIEELRLPIPSS